MEGKPPFMVQRGSHTAHFSPRISQDRYKSPLDPRREHKPPSQWRSVLTTRRLNEMEYVLQLSLENTFFEVLRLRAEPLFPGID